MVYLGLPAVRLAAVAAILASAASVVAAASNVRDLTKTKDFDSTVGGAQGVLVEYFAPWCGHCKNLAPTYEKVADAFASKSDSVVIAKVDGDKNRDLSQRAGVKGFPTLKWYPPHSKDGEAYASGRDLDSIVKFVTEKSGAASNIKPPPPPPPPTALQLTSSNFDEIVLNPNNDALVEFYAPWCGHCKALHPTYQEVATDFAGDESCVVAQFNADEEAHKAIAQRYGISSFPTILFFPKGENKQPEPYNQGRSQDDFLKYLNNKCSTARLKGGSLSDLAGRMPSLDGIAARWYTSPADGRSTLYQELVSFIESMKGSDKSSPEKEAAASYYVRVMDKAGENAKFIEKETKRLAAILKKYADGTSKLTRQKVDEIKRKHNVLSAFTNERIAAVANKKLEDAKKEAASAKDEL
ncbi:uncharacterized protein PFL1_04753 [Pseudozyma flocculosa PF-1]|uniref:protein disulfide-isomerase n=2 Tax=Pseudozyma flocculosa TaxID=84751 RepID=A0A5C3F5L2_9BASI|nr:uncharacterized protein PFL1_04753 [Pseudozyma flocculosa PF-1]EPQ27615.1 hypothetical protein PFL1_04753 [Pseudozyma flocculosa PF-1]SPO39256.1 probable protein disulfide-isomerase precursor [Pseudozyma flocculosa]